jgi:hypothetical protein
MLLTPDFHAAYIPPLEGWWSNALTKDESLIPMDYDSFPCTICENRLSIDARECPYCGKVQPYEAFSSNLIRNIKELREATGMSLEEAKSKLYRYGLKYLDRYR